MQKNHEDMLLNQPVGFRAAILLVFLAFYISIFPLKNSIARI